MRDADEKNEAVRKRIGDWSAYGVGIGALLAAVQKAGVSYALRFKQGEHESRIYYTDAEGRWATTRPVQDRDAFTALRDALYQWVRATEGDG